MTICHRKRAEICIKISKFMTSHVKHSGLARNCIFSGTILNVIELMVVYICVLMGAYARGLLLLCSFDSASVGAGV